ncbi:MAG: hypothetical protein HFG34_06230 [Eubacterium sp.]|nr:hypothetical protein [Eubacterium sp.]
MKRLLRNSKKAVAGLVLAMMAVCMLSPVAQGSVDRYGARKKDSKGYYSYTKVSGYDDNGYGYKLKVEAKMADGEWSSRTDYGIVDIRSKSSSYFADARHRYQIGSGSRIEWKQN